MKSLPVRIISLALFLGMLWQTPARADEPSIDAKLCPPSSRPPEPRLKPIAETDQRIHVSADTATIDNEAVTTFTGNVQAQQADRELKADSVEYDRRTGEAIADGHIYYSTGEITLKGDRAKMNMNTNTGTVENSHYFTGAVNGRGEADMITILSPTEIKLDVATYTTCPPGDEAWQLSADEINLDKGTSQGTASGVVLRVSDIPIMYLPYIRFPIGDERLSGFLYPGFGVSKKNGNEIAIPFYWNIAPSMDATITPHNYSKRGLMLENQYRYLTENSNGQIEYNYINDSLYGESREKVSWVHLVPPNAGWSSQVNYNYVSDVSYIDDFAGSLGTASQTYLTRSGQVGYNANKFVFTTLVQDDQNISGEEQYQRLPMMKLDTRLGNEDNHLNYDINTEYVNYDYIDKSKVIGQRVKMNPYVSYPVHDDAGFFIPKLALQYIDYNLAQTTATQNQDPSVSVPVFSLDTGLFFERDTSLFDTGILHTLEPRLFYVYVPYKDQDDLPVFDTALTTFSETYLFLENRFSGGDRIGDTNQVTTALTTRFYRQDNGQELFNATLGQIVYFSDRKVTLPGQSVDDTDRSSYIAGLLLAPNRRFKINADLQWNPDSQLTEVSNTRVQYDAGEGRVMNVHQRFRRNDLHTQGASFAWRTGPAWQFFGGHEYDLENNHRLQNFLGLNYDNCCWGIRLVGIERFDQTLTQTPTGSEPGYERAIYLEFQLKGLSSIGSRNDIDTLLENGILGYTR